MSDEGTDQVAEQRRRTVKRLMDESEALQRDGIAPEIVMETMLALGVTSFVAAHGRDATAAVVETLPSRIRMGVFGG